jgi:hypothetical protein
MQPPSRKQLLRLATKIQTALSKCRQREKEQPFDLPD